MHALLLASAVLDCGAVAGIGLLLKRSARERDTTLAAQRAALERLCEDVVQLVRDAEKRTRGLAAALDARERRLRALIAETGRTDPVEARLLRDLERVVTAAPGRSCPGTTGSRSRTAVPINRWGAGRRPSGARAMKVNEPKVLLHQRLGRPTGRVSGARAGAADRVSVSDMGHLLAGLKAEVGPLDVLREEKVTRLRAVMAKGTYSADIQDVARQFLRELLGQLLA